ncbi:hypothetical protein [Mesorhizobium sp. Mes31]|uniref:hypothetical protein n=1 Tax=Mesorhizobium sp. Mes31 TaxID=2926017 RepID=UPI0021173728|nr:hypothetical protein [Mesorhizobium sp. Mes31]
MDDRFGSNPSAAMTRPLRHDITTFELSTIAPAPAPAAAWRQRPCATTSLSNTIKKSRKKGTNDNFHTA